MGAGTPPEDPFDGLPPLDDEWVSEAGRREQSAQQRAERYRRIAANHERIQRQQEADRRAEAASYRTQKAKPWIIAGVVVAAILVLVLII